MTTEKGTQWIERPSADIYTTMSNSEHIVLEMNDILTAYYTVARKRVVDVVIMQAVDYHLISGPSSPLKVLTPKLISGLSDEKFEQIAGEDDFTKSEREDLRKAIEELKKGRRILQGA